MDTKLSSADASAHLGRTQAERRAESDRRMLAAAAALIGEQGYSGTTLAQIGMRAGYSRGLVSQRFGSKEGLVQALVDSMHERFDMLLTAGGIAGLSGVPAVLKYVDVYWCGMDVHRTDIRAYYVMTVESMGALAPLRATFGRSRQAITDLVATQVRAAQGEGTVRPDRDAGAVAHLLVAMLIGATIRWLLEDEGVPARAGESRQAVAIAAEAILRG